MSYLIDTDRVAEFLKPRGRGASLLPEIAAAGLAISIITYAELYEGVHYGRDPVAGLNGLERFLTEAEVLGISQAVARRAAVIRGALRRAGIPVALPDVLIAATAMEHDLTLVTGNLRHFGRIPDLRLLA